MSFDFYMYPWTENEKKDFDCYSKIKLLSTDSNKEIAKKAHNRLVYGKGSAYTKLIEERLKCMDRVDVRTPSVNLSILPPFSFSLQFTFKLATPYLSKDDEQFYPCENPIRKDKVFKVPMVSGSTWKGNMRWTARKIINNNIVIERLFGNEKGEEEKKKFRRGRLNFYPTFFDKIGLEVINPHDRKTKAGTKPIYIESVPEGASGTFSILYVPFDLLGRQETEVRKQVGEDITVVFDALKKMMLEYGFSAKKSSGFGIARDEFKPEGIVKIKGATSEEEKFSKFDQIFEKMKDMLKPLGVNL